MPNYDYIDTVCVVSSAPPHLRPGEPASVVGISLPADRKGKFLEKFPDEVVYTIEFEGGDSIEVQESLLERGTFPGEEH
jgi:hypothetical protein